MISLLSFMERKKQKNYGSHLSYFLQPIDVGDFLAEHDSLIKRLKVAYSDSQSWDPKILPTIRELALMCGHLSYGANGIFSEADGLFKAAAALAGMCAFLDVFDRKIAIVEKVSLPDSTFFHLNETNHTSHLAYEPLAMIYTTWVKQKLAENPSIQFEPHWNNVAPNNSARKNLRLFYARHVLLPETLSWLADAGQLPLMELMKCLTIESDIENVPSSVIKARNHGVYRACLLERERIGNQLGEMLAPEGWQETLIRILRARILHDWEINAKDSPLRKGADGLFLFWPDVCPILIDDMKNFGLTDLPTDPDIWAGCLLNSGIIIPSKDEEGPVGLLLHPMPNPVKPSSFLMNTFSQAARFFKQKPLREILKPSYLWISPALFRNLPVKSLSRAIKRLLKSFHQK